jgi:hypothetical protein
LTAKDHTGVRTPADGGSEPDRSGYTRSDIEQFDRLMKFPSVAGDFRAENNQSSDLSPTPAVQHTEQDLLQFQRLMTFDSGRKSPPRSAGRAGRGATRDAGYSHSDNRLFDDLTSLAAARGTPPQDSPAERQTEAPDTQRYSDKDLQAFQKLTPSEPPAEDGYQDSGVEHPSAPDTAIGHIRIVEFDREHARRKESERRGAANIKIRYFD